MNDDALKYLADASALEELSVGQNQIKGSGLSQLKSLPKLVWLRLGENPLDTAVAVTNLKQLTNLQLLNLRGTAIDREAAKELSQALPKCDITIDGASYNPETAKWDYEAASQE
jgi:Leucine-rich repeat (LRR) protein